MLQVKGGASENNRKSRYYSPTVKEGKYLHTEASKWDVSRIIEILRVSV